MSNRSWVLGLVLSAHASLALAQAPAQAPQPAHSLYPEAWDRPDGGTTFPPLPGGGLPGPDEHAAPDIPATGPWSAPACPGFDCWVEADYLLWWVKKGPLPLPLVTTSSLDDPDVAILFGGNGIDYHTVSGGRLTAGAWLDHYGTIGIDARGFLLETRSVRHRFSSNADGEPPLGIPFNNADDGSADFADFATPGETVGRLDISSSTRLWGGETNLIFNFMRSPGLELEAVGGFRYLNLRESIRIDGSTGALAGQELNFGGDSFGPPAVTTTSDRFTTENSFYGGQFGARARLRWDRLFVDVTGKLAFGCTQEDVRVAGVSSLLAGPVGPLRTLPGGILAQPSNSGGRGQDEFAVVPEAEVRLGLHVGRCLCVSVGYNFLYWSRVARPGKQIDSFLSPGLPPTFAEFGARVEPLRPLPLISSTDFWAQGVSAGLEFTF